jgi:membrane fusion protein, multidrug efflux system
MSERERSGGTPSPSAIAWHRRRIVLIAAGFAILATGGALYWYQGRTPDPAGGPRPAGRAAAPVSIAIAARQDVPIYLTGLGIVQPHFNVGIHSQVDGRLQEILFTEGQHVKKGDVLGKIDPRLFQAGLDQAKAKKAQDQAQLVAVEKDLARFKSLALKHFESEQNVDLQQAKVDQLKASIASDEAAIEIAQTQLDYTTITAPNDGRMGVRQVDPGNLVRTSDAGLIATLVLTQPSAVLFTLPARALDDVRDAMARGPLNVTAFDQDNRRVLSNGTLLMLDNFIDQTTATFRLKAMFPNDDDRLWPGEFVNARLSLEIRSNVIAVPSNAVQRGPQGLFIWIVTASNTAVPRPIEVGSTTDDLTIVASGLSEGERVVTEGHYKLQRDGPVTFTPPQSADAGRPN